MLFPCLGVRLIGNYGIVPSSFPQAICRPGDQSVHPLLTLFQKGIVVSSTQAFLVQDVPINISVSSVTTLILLQNCLFGAERGLPLLPGHALPTPIQMIRLIPLLVNYPDALRLCQGFLYGFPVHFDGPRVSSVAPNLLSAQQSPHVADQKLAKELAAHRLAGPFDSPPFPQFRISTLGIVPKKSPGEYRLIHHLSYPYGSSVNDGIAFENCTVTYARIDDAIQLIRSAGQGCYLAKTDIQSAFRIIPIHPSDYPLLCMCWRGKYYYDGCMPMSCASSCPTSENFSTALEWLAKTYLHIPVIIHLLDDFLLVSPTFAGCHAHLNNFLSFCVNVWAF